MLKCASYLTTQNQTTRGSQPYTNWVTYDYILQSFQLLKLFCHQKVLCIPVLGGSHIFVRPDWFWFSHRFVRTSLVLFSFSSFYLLRTVSIKKKILNQSVLRHAHFYTCWFSHSILTNRLWNIYLYTYICISSSGIFLNLIFFFQIMKLKKKKLYYLHEGFFWIFFLNVILKKKKQMKFDIFKFSKQLR